MKTLELMNKHQKQIEDLQKEYEDNVIIYKYICLLKYYKYFLVRND